MDKLKNRFQNSLDFKPYIASVVFPVYKNLLPGSELTLDFPLTLLIGKNGTNKSSILHALYGCPEGKSTGVYWFATHLDPINERPAYFYRYEIPGKSVNAEVIKTIIKKDVAKKTTSKKLNSKKNYDPDYWEPARPSTKHGMAPFPDASNCSDMEGRSKTRWNAIKKDVLYLDFRSEISAFDKAFYTGSKTISRLAHREKLRRHSKPLKQAIEQEIGNHIYYKKERITKNYKFSPERINLVSKILGSEYKRITYIKHDYYSSDSFSVYLQKGDTQNYSEAFAGSGEASVVRLVYALEETSPKSLVLLDEPETSLHIEAQHELQKYILDKIKEKCLQVVISTHSPFFAKDLPDYAIKVLKVEPKLEGKVRIVNSSPADESSFYLGHRNEDANKINIYVEDKLAKLIVERASKMHLTGSEIDKLCVHYYKGGVSALINLAGYEASKDSSNVAILFDGDCTPNSTIQNESEIPASEDSELENKIKGWFGSCPKIPCDSGNESQKTSNFRNFITFSKERFRYLPFEKPEIFLIENSADLQSRPDKDNPKECFRNYVQDQLGLETGITSDQIFTIQCQTLNKIPENNLTFKEIATILKYFIALAPTNL